MRKNKVEKIESFYNLRVLIKTTPIILLILSCSLASFAKGDLDENLAESLKIEAAHNLIRLKSFKDEVKGNKIFDEEREKALSEFLEEQEKWDLYRDRGLREYRAEKRKDSAPRVGSVEYNAYLEEKESEEARYERSRKIHVETKNKFSSKNSLETISRLESEELGLYAERPRYDLRRRALNKWVNSGSKTGGSGFTGSSANYQPPPPPPVDFSPAPEFPAAPAPYEGFDESAQAPLPPPVFDSNNGGMSDGFMNPNGDLSIPPPPPPPPDFDF